LISLSLIRAGNANTGASLVVRAIFDGREATRNIDKYLMG